MGSWSRGPRWGTPSGSVPMILQSEAAECGLACLAMVAGAHGHLVDLLYMRRRFSLSLKGATLADLAQCAEALGLQARGIRADLDQLDQLVLPAVLHWDFNHFVVLVSAGARDVVVHDPARGRRRIGHEELSRHFTGVALEVVPAVGFEQIDDRQGLSWKQLLGRTAGLRRVIGQILLLAAALELFVLLSPFFLRWVVDEVLSSSDRDLLLTLSLGFSLLVVMQAATAAMRSWTVLHLAVSLNLQWLGNVFAHLLKLPLGWFERRHSGDIWSRFVSIQQIQRALTTSFLEALLDGAMVIVTLAMMVLYSLPLSVVALVAVGVYGLSRWWVFAPLREASEEALVQDAKKISYFLESLRGMMAIKLFNAELDRRVRFMNLAVASSNAEVSVRRLELAVAVGNRLVFGLERVAVIWLGALLVLDRSLSVGMLFAFFAYKEQFTSRVAALIDKVAELRMLKLHGERLADIVLSPIEIDTATAVGESIVGSRIELRGIHFRYGDTEPDVLQGINLVIEPGESVAIAGPSGCGKTTLVKVMLGILVPQRGELLVGGKPLGEVGMRAWRERVGTVMQEEALLAGSIGDNICFFDPQPDRVRIEDCARRADIHEEIACLPMGYETLVGDMGANLSGGQRQRVLLARALYKRPLFLFLDEATSALDVEGERVVNEAIRRLSLTRVIVAHRPETIASADRVVVLERGSIRQGASVREASSD